MAFIVYEDKYFRIFAQNIGDVSTFYSYFPEKFPTGNGDAGFTFNQELLLSLDRKVRFDKDG
ncbi:MAG: hypothetical protein NC209_07910 [Alistipes sp.]|nr:hypothetical protein [Alistipes sp.]